MGIFATVVTPYEEQPRRLYFRLNHTETSNHGVESIAVFRGYSSKEAFEGLKAFVVEVTVTFEANVSEPLWGQAYAALKALPEFADAEDDVAPTDLTMHLAALYPPPPEDGPVEEPFDETLTRRGGTMLPAPEEEA